jgi:selenocysteine-specific elongation factor
VLTGTVLAGLVAINDTVDFPSIKTERKVKSIQVFHKPVDRAVQGDRIGICVTQLPDAPTRTLVCHPHIVSSFSAAILSVVPIKWFKDQIKAKEKYHSTS